MNSPRTRVRTPKESETWRGKTTYTAEECCELFLHCRCNFELEEVATGRPVASTPSVETFYAVKRLFGMVR